jgi:peptidoglycan/xylan/chitin deacetylase (PgdA/CDA1 family)
VFAVSARLGARNGWDAEGELAGRPLLDAGALAELAAAGIEIGAHTRRHPRLPALTDAALEDEVAGARDELASVLGTPVTTFAYPHGLHDARVRAAVERAGFDGACSTEGGVNGPATDRFRLRRVNVRGTTSRADFAWRVAFGSAAPWRRGR